MSISESEYLRRIERLEDRLSRRTKGPAEGNDDLSSDTGSNEARALAAVLGLPEGEINYTELFYRARVAIESNRALMAEMEEARAQAEILRLCQLRDLFLENERELDLHAEDQVDLGKARAYELAAQSVADVLAELEGGVK